LGFEKSQRSVTHALYKYSYLLKAMWTKMTMNKLARTCRIARTQQFCISSGIVYISVHLPVWQQIEQQSVTTDHGPIFENLMMNLRKTNELNEKVSDLRKT